MSPTSVAAALRHRAMLDIAMNGPRPHNRDLNTAADMLDNLEILRRQTERLIDMVEDPYYLVYTKVTVLQAAKDALTKFPGPIPRPGDCT